jgi:hypothetical protein
MRALMARAMASPSPKSLTLAVTSRNASSTEMGSTRSVKASKTARISREMAAYFDMSGEMKTPWGQRRKAVEMGIALPTPNFRAA